MRRRVISERWKPAPLILTARNSHNWCAAEPQPDMSGTPSENGAWDPRRSMSTSISLCLESKPVTPQSFKCVRYGCHLRVVRPVLSHDPLSAGR